MRHLVLAAVALILAALALGAPVGHRPGTADAVACGVERWPVKTLSDADAPAVDFTAVPATVAELRSLPSPGSLPADSRIAPTELTTYAVTVNVLKFKLEDDRDIHVVVSDLNDPAQTMIVEFPDAANCDGASTSTHAAEMKAARSALTATYGNPSSSSFRNLSGTATFVGVGFFDFKHGQTGVAPNAIEGDANAPVKLDLYGNFLCLRCRNFARDVLPQLITDYVASGKVSITFHDTALGGGDSVENAQGAARCAADQGKFWPAFAVLYQNFSGFDAPYVKPSLESLLAQTGVNSTTLNNCLDSDQHKSEVDASTDAFMHLADNNTDYANELATATAEKNPTIPLLVIGGTYFTTPDGYAPVRAAIQAKLGQ